MAFRWSGAHDEVEKVPYRRWLRDRGVHDPSLVLYSPSMPWATFSVCGDPERGRLRRVGLAVPSSKRIS